MGKAPKKPYNILMLAPTMFFADYGCHVRILEEAVVLQEMGHKVTILAYPNGRNIAGLDVRRSLGVPFNYRIEVGSNRHRIYLDAMLALKSVWHVIRHKPDIIHAHLHEGGLLGWFLSKLTNAPLIFDFQGSLTSEMLDHGFINEESRFFKPLRWLEKQIDHMGQAVLTSSQHSAQLLIQDYAVPAGRVHPTPDCVNPNTFHPNVLSKDEKIELKQKLGIPLDKQLLVYVGLLTEYQGVPHMLKALSQLTSSRDDFHLLLMGFPALAYYQSMANELGIGDKVKFTGKMPYEELAAYLSLGNVAIAPKLSRTEGNGKVLNYMSMALPIVAFDTPVNREYLGQHGLFAQESTPEALADAINLALNMPANEQRSQGQALRRWVQANYTWQKIGRQIETVYDAVLAGDPCPALAVATQQPS